MSLANRATAAFEKHFGYAPLATFHAPGRVNLIGEHTDYNNGFVLPAAINYGTTVAAARRADMRIRACALDMGEDLCEFDLSQPLQPSVSQGWSNYLRGMCQYLLQAGVQMTGADLTIAGDVPYGAGLSSSAALEMVIARTFSSLFDHPLEPSAAALMGQRTENQFIGANTGIMDQLISADGKRGHALLIDCQSLASKAIALDDDFAIVIFNSNVQRGLVDSEYNLRREQCQQAAAALGVDSLRDADLAQLAAIKSRIPEVIYRRAHHVISENNRTLQAAQALQQKDWPLMAELMIASQQSMQEDFEITVAPIDGLVDIINRQLPIGAGAARMTGGGFGGCVVALVAKTEVESTIAAVNKHYHARFGLQESVYICHAVDGAFNVR